MSYWTTAVQEQLAEADLKRATAEHIGDILKLSPSVLRRRLRSEGSRFADLLETERRRRCLSLLKSNPNESAHSLQDSCGYWTINSFYRAFKEWFGVKLRDFRQNPDVLLDK